LRRGSQFCHAWSRNNFTLNKKKSETPRAERSIGQKIVERGLGEKDFETKIAGADGFLRQIGADRTAWVNKTLECENTLKGIFGKELGCAGLAGPVVAVDPNLMVMMPRPMSRNPAPVAAASPVPRPIKIIGPIANFDIDAKRICTGNKFAQAKQNTDNQK
jgi:hypothetical protein